VQGRAIAAAALVSPPRREGPTPPGSAEKKPFLQRGAAKSRKAPAEVHKERVARDPKPSFLAVPVADDTRPGTPRREAVPKRGDQLRLKERSDKQFIKENRAAADAPKAAAKAAPRSKAAKASPSKHGDFGRKPAYLVQRNEELAREKAAKEQRNYSDPKCPPGMTRLDDAERIEALEGLRAKRKQIKDDLFKMPLNVTTTRMKMRQEALHKQLDDVEASIKIFEREVVYVQE